MAPKLAPNIPAAPAGKGQAVALKGTNSSGPAAKWPGRAIKKLAKCADSPFERTNPKGNFMRSRSIFIKRFRQLLVLGTVATIVLAASPAMAEVIDAGPVQVGTTSQDNASDTVAISNGGSAGGGLVGVSTTGFASGLLLGVSGTNCAFGFLGAGISGTGCAVGYVAVSGMDPAAGQVAVSGTDGAYAALVGVSGTGFGGGGLAGVSVLGPAFGGTAAISGANTATAPVALGGTSGAAYPCANHGGVRFASARTEAGVIEIRVYCNDGTQEGPFVYRVPAG